MGGRAVQHSVETRQQTFRNGVGTCPAAPVRLPARGHQRRADMGRRVLSLANTNTRSDAG